MAENSWYIFLLQKQVTLTPKPNGALQLNHLIGKLRQSSEWRDKSERTRDEIEGELKVIKPLFGPTHVLDVSPDACLAFYDGLREKHSLNKAAKCMKWLRYLFNYAIRINYQGITHNPTAAVRIRKPAARTQTWNEAQVEDAIQIAWIEGLRGAAVAIAVAYDTSLRPGDIRALKRSQMDGESLWVVQSKTGTGIRVPLWPSTAALIERYWAWLKIDHHPEALIVMTQKGRPYSRHHLAKQVRQILRQAGIPDGVQLRDLRRTASVERADGGATAYELASGTGHSIGTSQQILDTYNPRSYDAAKSAQEKRKAKKKRTKTAKKFESHQPKSLKASAGKS